MKTLFIVRHAKSSWDYKGIDDIDRPLKKSGIKDAHLISKLKTPTPFQRLSLPMPLDSNLRSSKPITPGPTAKVAACPKRMSP